jgi:hypothetical protein
VTASALGLILRDVAELASWFPLGTLVVVAALALPIAAGVMAVRGHRVAWASVAASAALFSSWFLYYSADVWSNAGQGIWTLGAAVVFAGWLVLAVSATGPELALSRTTRLARPGAIVSGGVLSPRPRELPGASASQAVWYRSAAATAEERRGLAVSREPSLGTGSSRSAVAVPPRTACEDGSERDRRVTPFTEPSGGTVPTLPVPPAHEALRRP